MLTPIDAVAVLLLMTALPAYLHYVDFPKTRADILSGRPGARLAAYRRTLWQQWLVSGLVLVGWALARRAWPDLRLAWPHGAELWATLVIAAVGAAFAAMQAAAVARTPATLAAVRAQFTGLEWLLPHTRSEAGWFRL